MSNRHVGRRSSVGTSGCFLLALTIVFAPISGRAQSSGTAPTTLPGETGYRLAALICDHDPGPYEGREQRFPDGCHWLAGMWMSVESLDGRPIDSCITLANGWCHRPIDQGAVVLREDISLLPSGYVPQVNPRLAYESANGMWIINIPAAAVPDPNPAAARLTIHSRFCPVGFTSPDYYDICNPIPAEFRSDVFCLWSRPHGGGSPRRSGR